MLSNEGKGFLVKETIGAFDGVPINSQLTHNDQLQVRHTTNSAFGIQFNLQFLSENIHKC